MHKMSAILVNCIVTASLIVFIPKNQCVCNLIFVMFPVNLFYTTLRREARKCTKFCFTKNINQNRYTRVHEYMHDADKPNDSGEKGIFAVSVRR